MSDERAIIARRLAVGRLDRGQQVANAVDRREHGAHGVGRYFELALADAAQHFLGRVRERFEPRQGEEAAGPLDGVEEAEDPLQQRRIGIAFERHEIGVEDGDALARLGQEVSQEIVHEYPATAPPDKAATSREKSQKSFKDRLAPARLAGGPRAVRIY